MSKRLTLRQIYKEFEIPFDLRAARKLLNLPKETPRTVVNKQLKQLYYEQKAESYQPLYSHTLSGVIYDKRPPFSVKDITFTFQSKKKYALYPFNLIGDDSGEQDFKFPQNKYPTFTDEDAPASFEPFLKRFMDDTKDAPIHYKVWTVDTVSIRKIPKGKKQLADVPLFRNSVNCPYKGFNGFKDTGVGRCVPETILHHLKVNGRFKKLTLEKVIDTLEEVYISDDDDDVYFYEDADGKIIEIPKEECPNEERGKRGYTPHDIIRTLESYKCRGRLVDIHQKAFLTTDYALKYDKNLQSFLGMVYDEHLYYCDDQKLVTSFNNSRQNSTCFQEQVYEKVKKYEDTKLYEIIATSDLTDYYKEFFKGDNTIRLVKTKNGKITNILCDENTSISANPEKDIMLDILGKDFKNENTTMLGEILFKEHFPTHKCSQFTKEVFDRLHKHGNIVESYNVPNEKVQHEHDINKCRTDCTLNNKLGDYERFDVSAQMEEYVKVKTLKTGIYYIELESLKDREFFMRGNTWYSKQFIEIGQSEGFKFIIKYQLIATDTLKADYFKKFIQKIIKKYPNHYKHIVNKFIGYRGKTTTKSSQGYVETDWEMAVAAFWNNNEDQIGFIDEKNVEIKKWKLMKGNSCNIHNLEIDENTTHYIVEFNEFKTLYENDLPIFNKILENEYLRLYKLKKSLGGRLIKVKTDAVVVEGKHNKIKLSKEIGGIKHNEVFYTSVNIKDIQLDTGYKVDTSMNWKITYEQEDGSIETPNGSYLVTGLAGFGKSYCVKQQKEYNEDTTLRLAFTNCATENICDPEHPAHTLNSYFGINCKTGRCSEKKLKNMHKIQTIIISEIFMTPSYLMGHLSKIKNQFPHIKFICEGDPEQTRPVGEEETNWLETKLLFNLCDGNMVKLTINKRNNETENYHKILRGEELDASKHSAREPQQVNICRTNAMRVTINQQLMNRDGYFIIKSKLNPKSQDVWLTLDTPVMCVKNNKKLSLKNGASFKLTSIEKDKIVVGENTFTDALFAEYFVVSYAMTNHKIQGLTIKENFNIYEWTQMSTREKYTAYSRTSDGDNVKINTHEKPNYEFYNELQHFFKPNYVIYKWTSSECNDVYVGHTKDFEERKAEHLRDAKTKNNDLYKKMREFGGWTMERLDDFYAPNRREAEKKEQEWIDKLNSNLNMHNAYKVVI